MGCFGNFRRISGNVKERQTLLDYYNRLVDNKKITGTQLLEHFNVKKSEVRAVLQPIAKILITFAYYLKTGNLLPENGPPQIFDDMISKEDWESWKNNDDISEETLIKLLRFKN